MTGGTPAPVTGPIDVPAEAFTVSPELAEDTLRKISDLQDVVGRMVREAKVLARSVPLGGGYAAEIGEFMARYGIDDGSGGERGDTATGDAVDSAVAVGDGALGAGDDTRAAQAAVPALVGFGKELAALRSRIDDALERYRRADDDAAGELGGVDCSGG